MAIYYDYFALKGYNIKPLVLSSEPIEKSVDSDQEALLRLIFTIDPDSNLPKGDIGQVLGKNLAPEVVQFIKDNLMADVSKFGAIGMPAGVDDDVALNLARDVNETRSQYIQRVKDYMFDQRETIRLEKNKILDRANVEPPKDD